MLILELEVPLASNCRVLVKLMVPLMVMISPALALATAAFKADSLVTVVDTAFTPETGAAEISAAELGEEEEGCCSVIFWQLAIAMTSAATLMKLFINRQLMVKKMVVTDQLTNITTIKTLHGPMK
jgi:hypothetical protein